MIVGRSGGTEKRRSGNTRVLGDRGETKHITVKGHTLGDIPHIEHSMVQTVDRHVKISSFGRTGRSGIIQSNHLELSAQLLVLTITLQM